MEGVRHSKEKGPWPSGDCFLKLFGHLSRSRVILVSSITKLYQPRSNSVISWIIDPISYQSSQPYSLRFNLSWLCFSIDIML